MGCGTSTDGKSDVAPSAKGQKGTNKGPVLPTRTIARKPTVVINSAKSKLTVPQQHQVRAPPRTAPKPGVSPITLATPQMVSKPKSPLLTSMVTGASAASPLISRALKGLSPASRGSLVQLPSTSELLLSPVGPMMNASPPSGGNRAARVLKPDGRPQPSTADAAPKNPLEKAARLGSNPMLMKSTSDLGSTTRSSRVGSNGSIVSVMKTVTFVDEDFEGFQTLRLLGKGAFGNAYECALKCCKIVCVKVIELGNIPGGSEEKARLLNEISLMKRLNHPNIVQYLGCTEDPEKKTINIFMEYITGGSLLQYVKKFHTVPVETCRQWAFQVVCGVKYLHDQSIVHRDIKGANLLVTNDGTLKLADFGCSRSLDDVCSKTRGCQTMVGTPYWMAPEVLKCEGYGPKSDVWSIGCTVVEMMTGKPPWPEFDSMWTAVYKIANSTGLPSQIPKDLPPDMMHFLRRCFERDPKKRATIYELFAHRWLAGLEETF